jgi:predicted nucleic acid-binding protein
MSWRSKHRSWTWATDRDDDACVLYPAQLRDLLLRVALTDLFKARWTDRIHDEWIRNLAVRRPDIPAEKLQHTRRLMDRAVPDCLVTDYEPYIDKLELPDPNDRHVLAAAIRAQAGVIVTLNTADFPEAAIARHGISVQHPDEFLSHLFDLAPGEVCAAVRAMRLALRNPPRTATELLEDLLKLGLPRTVSLLSPMESLL